MRVDNFFSKSVQPNMPTIEIFYHAMIMIMFGGCCNTRHWQSRCIGLFADSEHTYRKSNPCSVQYSEVTSPPFRRFCEGLLDYTTSSRGCVGELSKLLIKLNVRKKLHPSRRNLIAPHSHTHIHIPIIHAYTRIHTYYIEAPYVLLNNIIVCCCRKRIVHTNRQTRTHTNAYCTVSIYAPKDTFLIGPVRIHD